MPVLFKLLTVSASFCFFVVSFITLTGCCFVKTERGVWAYFSPVGREDKNFAVRGWKSFGSSLYLIMKRSVPKVGPTNGLSLGGKPLQTIHYRYMFIASREGYYYA